MADQPRPITDPGLASELTGRLAAVEPLTDEDFAHLFQQSLTSKANADKTRAFLNGNNVTQQERDAFYAFVNRQAKASLTNRVDTNLATVGGVNVSPEDALMVGSGMLAAAKGAPTALRLAKGALTGVAPIVKYETVKYGLERIGVPMPLATVVAAGLAARSGRAESKAPQRGPRPRSAKPMSPEPAPATTPVAAPVPAPAAPAPAAAASEAAVLPSAAVTAKFNPATALQQAKDAFAAAKAVPQPGELSWVTAYMKAGLTPEAAVAKALTYRPKPAQSAAEALVQNWGTPSDAEMASVVAAKNARTTPARGGTKR